MTGCILLLPRPCRRELQGYSPGCPLYIPPNSIFLVRSPPGKGQESLQMSCRGNPKSYWARSQVHNHHLQHSRTPLLQIQPEGFLDVRPTAIWTRKPLGNSQANPHASFVPSLNDAKRQVRKTKKLTRILSPRTTYTIELRPQSPQLQKP